jgi:type II secretory pathway pseudopilin PulG
MSQILVIISSLLAIVIGLWKYFTGKARKKQKRKEDAANEIKQGMDENDPSKITGGLDNLNRG